MPNPNIFDKEVSDGIIVRLNTLTPEFRGCRKVAICKLSLLLLIFCSCSIVFSQKIYDEYGKRQVVLIERNPWLMVIGSDTPTFALYDTGQVIYKVRDRDSVKTYEAHLDAAESSKFIEGLELSDSFYNLPNQIVVSSWTDQPDNFLLIDITKQKTVNVYGNLRRTTEMTRDKKAPIEFMRVYEKLINFSHKSAKEWQPKVIEVMLWDFDYAKNKIAWPKTLPDLNSATTKKFNDGAYSVFIESGQFEEFKKFYQLVAEKTAVLINGKKMAISYRYPFPGQI